MNVGEVVCVWRESSEYLVLPPHEIHVWRVPLNIAPSQYRTLWSILAFDEQQRANRLTCPSHRAAFVATRSCLRLVLSRYLPIQPGDFVFELLPKGKPYLSHLSHPHGLTFNVTHSEKLALVAVSLNRRVGVDVEYHREGLDYQALMQRIGSVQEIRSFRSLSPAQQEAGFFACWTRKEAFVKAIGQGLSFSLKKVTVSVQPDRPASLLQIDGTAGHLSDW